MSNNNAESNYINMTRPSPPSTQPDSLCNYHYCKAESHGFNKTTSKCDSSFKADNTKYTDYDRPQFANYAEP
ncbi:hypothetical protein MRX96_004009 [Rhipicephalus microplus]